MARLPNRVRNYIFREIRKQNRKGKPIRQSITIGFSKARKKFPKYKRDLTQRR